MSALSQKSRLLQWTSPADKNSLIVSLSGEESFSTCYKYKVEVIATDLVWDPSKLIGETASVKIMYRDENDQLQISRYVHGVVTHVTVLGKLNYTADQSALTMRRYQCVIQPQLILLKYSRHNRVFQKAGQTTLDIIKKLLDLYGISIDISQVNSNLDRPYCMQYQESDYEFFIRLCGMSGLCFYFKHESDSHVLILMDQASGYMTDVSCEVYDIIESNLSNALIDVEMDYQILPGKLSIKNQLLENPNQSIASSLNISSQYQSSSLTSMCNQFMNVFDCQNNDMAKNQLQSQSDRYASSSLVLSAKLNQSMQLAQMVQLQGQSFSSYPFKEYVVSMIRLTVEDTRGIVDEHFDKKPCCRCSFYAIEKSKISPISFTHPTVSVGLQLAQVVNAKGKADQSQVYNNDDLGRVCVRFSWEDYEGVGIESNQFDQCNVSCPSSWDNGVLRVGTMVLVGFINNDYDKPVIVNAINNSNQLLLGKYSNDNASTSILQRIPGVDNVDYNSIKFIDKDSKQALIITAPNELNGQSKKETYTTENHSRTVKEEYSLEAESEKYKSKGLKRNVDGTYELTANAILIKGDLTLTGNLKVNGNVDIV